MEEYERHYKRGRTQEEIVLTREQREQILREWCTTQKDIAQSTRDNLKIKFQRRRSVRNARKVEKLQNTISNGIKKVFGIGRRKSDELQMVPETGSSQFLDSHEKFVEVSEPEDDENDSEPPSVRISSVLLRKQSSSFADMVDDARSVASGITFGDSTTTSAYEMEMFHRELEMEMFGMEPDELDEPPNMLGQTLELEDAMHPETNCLSVVSGSIEEEMSTSSSTFHSFQSPSYSYQDPHGPYQDPHSYVHNQIDQSPDTMQYSTLEQQLAEPNYQQSHHIHYNPYARTSAYRGYSLRDAYRGNTFSAFDVANQQTHTLPYAPLEHYHGQQHPEAVYPEQSMPLQSQYQVAPVVIPPSMYSIDQSRNSYTDMVQPIRYSSDDSRTGFSDVRSWEERYNDMHKGHHAYETGRSSGESYADSHQSMNWSNHSNNTSYGSPMSFTRKPLSAQVSVDISERTQHC